ncbi:alginate export family protein [Parasphingorhabdus halotolerans]|uniref:Alginate export family protein n=1 Tax=Parasphingorhabdus halotolerans TaxID=2725558 RepID=A0A6H2DRC3_9SPHN|nr:alginate export family protein [Parasphingorhabdus halotolerans]QJB70311.1 alginate export family protein [Parasphingorhabdus halotolerans]
MVRISSRLVLSYFVILPLLFGSPAVAGSAGAKGEADEAIKPYIELRYRLETVDQDGLPRDATASTLRVKAGIESGEWQGFSFKVEGEAIANVGAEKFNDTLNGKTQFPVVADPEDVVLNQAYVRWRHEGVADIKLGRQTVNLDNQRWIGSVGWRQNDQTMDAALVTVSPAKGFSATYGYSWRVNRIFGPDSPIGTFRNNDIHLIQASYDAPVIGSITAYAYLLDIPNAPGASSQTYGVRLAGKQDLGGAKLLYTAEYAQQSDYGPNPANFRHDYLLLEPGIATGPVTVKIGLERLEGDGTTALRTPLATLHAFNGWADKFLNTPANGLRDIYGDVVVKPNGPKWLKETTFRAVYHDYKSTSGNLDYGQEWNFLIARSFGKHVSVSLKYADYDSDGFATDTQKFWFTTQLKF